MAIIINNKKTSNAFSFPANQEEIPFRLNDFRNATNQDEIITMLNMEIDSLWGRMESIEDDEDEEEEYIRLDSQRDLLGEFRTYCIQILKEDIRNQPIPTAVNELPF